jgi:hypothetical protein
LHRLEVALHAVNTDGQRVLEIEMFGVFGEQQCKVTLERHVVAHEHAVSDRESKSHGSDAFNLERLLIARIYHYKST